MTDDNRSGDETYHYPEEEYVVETQQASQPQKNASQDEKKSQDVNQTTSADSLSVWQQFLQRNKRKVGIAFAGVLALIAFQVLHYKKDNQVIMQRNAKPVPAQQVKTQTQKTDSVAENNLLLQQSLKSMQQKAAQKDAQINYLKNELQGLQAQIRQQNLTSEQTKQAMVLLLQELKHVNARLALQQHKKKTGLPGPELVYRVRAVVKGRAWIVGSNGLSLTVTTGDPVPGYGVVEGIDPERGVITTTTGKSIGYGLNDF